MAGLSLVLTADSEQALMTIVMSQSNVCYIDLSRNRAQIDCGI